MTRICYVEDDRDIAGVVSEYLEERGFQVSLCAGAQDAREALGKEEADLVILDWNMPDGDGMALCRWIRDRWPRLPLIFLTVRSDTRDIVNGLEGGADDYVTKPFELEILFSRIQALLRRSGREQILSCGDIRLDRDRMEVRIDGRKVELGQTEYQILLLLMENKGRTVTRQRLLEQVWDSGGSYVNDNTLTVAVKRLREKLGSPESLRTVRSFGYRMEAGDEKGEKRR